MAYLSADKVWGEGVNVSSSEAFDERRGLLRMSLRNEPLYEDAGVDDEVHELGTVLPNVAQDGCGVEQAPTAQDALAPHPNPLHEAAGFRGRSPRAQ